MDRVHEQWPVYKYDSGTLGFCPEVTLFWLLVLGRVVCLNCVLNAHNVSQVLL